MRAETARRNISANITRLLAARNMRPLQLAEEVRDSSTQNTIYRIVRGDTCGTIPVLAAIAEVLGVTIDYLVSDPDTHEKKVGGRRRSKLHAAS